MIKLLIIADDFTGALDTGVQFAMCGAETIAVTRTDYQFENISGNAEVLVMDAETRHLDAQEAYTAVFEITKRAVQANIPYIYKKTDSALRGNIGSELTALIHASKQKNLNFLPAFPKMNRIVKNGTLFVDGVFVHESSFGKDPYEPVTCSYVPDIIGNQSDITVRVVKNKNEQSDIIKNSSITVFDSKDDKTIRNIAIKLQKNNQLRIMAGCAGFASVLPEVLNLGGKKPKKPDLQMGLLVACGSVNPITKRQLEYAEKNGFTRVRLTPRQKMEKGYFQSTEGKKFLEELYSLCKENSFCMIDTNDLDQENDTYHYAKENSISRNEIRVRISETLGYVVKELIDAGINSTLLITGGDSLMGFMKEIQCNEIIPVCEVTPGTVLSKMKWNGKQYHVISKSGGFGEETLISDLAKMIVQRKEEEE